MKLISMVGAYFLLLCSSLVSSRPTVDIAAALADDQATSIQAATSQTNLTALHTNSTAKSQLPGKGVSYLAQKANKAAAFVIRRNPIIKFNPTKGIKYVAQDSNPVVEALLSPRDFNLTDAERQRFEHGAQSMKQAAADKASSRLGLQGIKYVAQSRNAAIPYKMVRRQLGARDQPDAEVLEPRKWNISKADVRHEGYKYLAQSANAAVRAGKLLRRRLGSRHLPDAEVLEPRKWNISKVDVHHEGYKYLAQTANAAVKNERREASPEPVAQPEADPQPIPDPDAHLE
ncbi:MAG: hypothetical protein Q9228_000922 [Teloschistes exilis]